MSQPPRRRLGQIVRRVLVGLVVVVLVALVAGYWYARPLLLTGTGYAAHNACAVQFVTGRDNPQADLPPNPLVPYLTTTTEKSGTDGGVASSSIKGLLAGQKAWFTPGLGCVVGPEKGNHGTVTAIPAGKNPYTSVPAPTMKPDVAAALARAFGDDLDAAGKKALGTRGIVVLRNGNLIGERYGEGFDATTPQLGWSMTKSVAVLMVGRLVKEGKLRVGDAHLRPEWTDGRAAITVDQLMRMTSGIEWDETYDLGTPITRMLYLEPSMADYVAGLPLAHQPGRYQQYSSGSTNLLCSVIQDRVGRAKDAPADFPRTLLFEPLGLSSAVLEPDAAGLPVCSSYMWATPRDWAAVGQFALQGGNWNGVQLLPGDWMKETTTVVPTQDGTDDEGYAAGWRNNTLPDGSLVDRTLPADAFQAVGHDGQRIVVVPSAQLVVVRLGFSPDADDLRVNQLVATLAAQPVGG